MQVFEKYGGSTLGFKEIGKYFDALSETQVQCKKCGRKRPFVLNAYRLICDWCGNYIYKDEKTEFKYKLKEEMERQKRNER